VPGERSRGTRTRSSRKTFIPNGCVASPLRTESPEGWGMFCGETVGQRTDQ
jgi:hypothetical protein